jgi:hypothetical protein
MKMMRSLFVVLATILGTCALTAILFLALRPCSVGAMAGLLFYGLSIPPAITFLAFDHRRTGQIWPSIGRSVAFWAVLAICLSVAISNLFGAMDRSRQKWTMAQLRALGRPYEQRRQAGTLTHSRDVGPLDAWGQPILIATKPDHYVLVSCGECGDQPEHSDLFMYPPGPTSSFESDIVYSDGNFVAYPEGIQT